jgi:hypothetical protein
MGKKYKYQIGDWVEFKTYVKVVSQDGCRTANVIGLAKPKTGLICGAIIRHLGDIHDSGFKYGQNYLVIKKTITLYQVRIGMINVPFEIREEDIRLIEKAHLLKVIPWRKTQLSPWAKERLSKAAKSQLRDSKGRFVRHVLKVVGE